MVPYDELSKITLPMSDFETLRIISITQFISHAYQVEWKQFSCIKPKLNRKAENLTF